MKMAIKSIAPDGTFEGALAVYNNVDLGGDVIEPGAFTKTIQDNGNEVVLLWQHKTDTPIGKLTLTDTPQSLNVKGQLLMEVPAARNAYLLIKARVVKGLSIGFDAVKETIVDNVRRLKEVRLWEGSIVTFPMNEQAMITSVKSWRERQQERKELKEAKADFNTELADIQLQDAMYQMYQALRYSLMSIPFSSEMNSDEKIAASKTSLDQFAAAYMEFLPAFLEMLDREYGDMTYYGREPDETKDKKSGRKISNATKQQIVNASSHLKSADEILTTLCMDEADDDATDVTTSIEDKAVDSTREPESAAIDHSAANTLIGEIRALIPAA